ncbi:hypothetical protein [Streptomyces sp. NPDC087272]|uniref:hypothetical protein n=1 Tax=Streptomyces sp. NPDC087272 TaxID=3365775 RepID=UPI00381063BA
MNTRKLDREIALKRNRLERLRAEDSTALSAGDQAKLAGLMGIAFARATRLKGAPGAERAAERLYSRAIETAAADLRVLEAERQQVLTQAAAARREKRSSGWW